MPTVLMRVLPMGLSVALAVALTTAPAVAAGSSVERAAAAEAYAHDLLNCTRTGGFVRADGRCLKRGSGTYSARRAPLRLHRGISRQVAWPWARAMAVHDFCGHAFASLPDLSQRMRLSGFRYQFYGENVGCGTGDPEAVVLAVHRMMQAERRTQGGHWRNIKQKGYKSVGVGVAVSDGRTTVVWDFYGRRY